MQQGIYEYQDDAVKKKIELMRKSITYFKNIEPRALTELAF